MKHSRDSEEQHWQKMVETDSPTSPFRCGVTSATESTSVF